MPRTFSICCILFAWLCANGVACNTVCSTRCAPQTCGAQAIGKTCDCCNDGFGKCEGCLSEKTELPSTTASNEALGDGMEGYILASETAHEFLLIVPQKNWPNVGHDDGLTRTEPVPVRPPRV